jgi:hypothetical protein
MLSNLYLNKKIKIRGLTFKESDIIDEKTKLQFKFFKIYHKIVGNVLIENEVECNEDDSVYYEIDEDFAQTTFCIGELKGDLVFLSKDVFELNHDFAFCHSLLNKKIENSIFSIYSYQARTLIPTTICEYSNSNCYIVPDGDNRIGENGYIPISAYLNLVRSFPTQTELKYYKYTRIANCICEFFDKDDHLEKYHNYMSKKISQSSSFSYNAANEFDIEKYKFIYNEIISNLGNTRISEEEWQKKLTRVVCLLYPQYIICLSKVPVQYSDDSKKTKELDCLLVDADGNACILELKKPFDNMRLLSNSYRKNFFQPKFELAGGVQQIEEYIYDFNLYKKENMNLINKHFEEELSKIKINLIDVHGVLICGRSNNFSNEEKRDFEIIRKQYKNVVDILTYDDILRRLNNTINLFESSRKK